MPLAACLLMHGELRVGEALWTMQLTGMTPYLIRQLGDYYQALFKLEKEVRKLTFKKIVLLLYIFHCLQSLLPMSTGHARHPYLWFLCLAASPSLHV